MSLPMRLRVTDRTHEVFRLAHRLAEDLGHDDVTALHVAICIMREGEGVAAAVLTRAPPLKELEREMTVSLPSPAAPKSPVRDLSWTPGMERILEQAKAESQELGDVYQGTEHLLLAILRDPAGAPAQVLTRHGFGFDEARTELLRLLGRSGSKS